MPRWLLSLPLLLAGCPTAGGDEVVINELLASNVTGITDDSGDTPDWIELFNPGEAAVSLDGWSLSDDSGVPERQPLNGLTLEAGAHLLLFASGDTTLGADHLPFRLSQAGEEVVLTGPEGRADQVAFGEQVSDVSLARLPDGTGDWVAASPTPGAPNE